jgi:hypothetical protein
MKTVDRAAVISSDALRSPVAGLAKGPAHRGPYRKRPLLVSHLGIGPRPGTSPSGFRHLFFGSIIEAMPALTRRPSRDRHDCWRVFYGESVSGRSAGGPASRTMSISGSGVAASTRAPIRAKAVAGPVRRSKPPAQASKRRGATSCRRGLKLTSKLGANIVIGLRGNTPCGVLA